MKQHPFTIISDQVTSSLSSFSGTIAPSTSVPLGVQNVAGLGGVQILAIGDQPFCVVVQESGFPGGPFVTTHTFCSTASGGQQVVSQTFVPVGSFAQFTIDNGPTAQSQFSFSVNGVSVPTTISSTGSPGAVITSEDVAVPVGTTQPLPAIPAGTRRMTVQNKGPAGTWVLVREVGAGAGVGRLLPRLGEATYGGGDGALAPLEVEDVSTTVGGDPVATTIDVQFEGG